MQRKNLKWIVCTLAISIITIATLQLTSKANNTPSGNASLSGNTSVSGNTSQSGNSIINSNNLSSESGNPDTYIPTESDMENDNLNLEALMEDDTISIYDLYNDLDEDSDITSALTLDDIIIETLSGAKKNLSSNYSNVSSVTAEKSKYICSVKNYSQSTMNSDYQKKTGIYYDNTCGIVSLTGLAEYYHRKEYAPSETNVYINFKWMMDYALKKQYYEKNVGTVFTRMDDILTAFLDYHESTLVGFYIAPPVKDKIRIYNSVARPGVIRIDAPSGAAHAVTVCGYYDITVKYKPLLTTKTKTVRYYCINDGYKYCTQGDARVQYVNEKYVNGFIYPN